MVKLEGNIFSSHQYGDAFGNGQSNCVAVTSHEVEFVTSGGFFDYYIVMVDGESHTLDHRNFDLTYAQKASALLSEVYGIDYPSERINFKYSMLL